MGDFKNRGKDIGTGFKNRGAVLSGGTFTNRGAEDQAGRAFKNRGQVWFGSQFKNLGSTDFGINLLTKSESFDHSDWAKVNLNTTGMADVAVAPDGNTTADQLIENGTTNGFWLARSQSLSFVSGRTYTFSAFYKDKTGDRFPELVFPSAAFTANIIANFNLSTGACTISGVGTCAMTDAGSGWWRCSMTATATATASASIQLRITNSYTAYAPNYAGNNASGVYMWGAQLEIGSYATAYKKVA